MPLNTTRIQLPYPVAADTVDVPRDMLALANKLDLNASVYLQGTLALRPAPGTAGRLYFATDSDELFYDDGTAWNATRSSQGSAGGGGNLLVGDVGMVGQVRAGRELTVADFTDLGLSQPVGLWNLSALTNLGSDGRALVNKGAVPFGLGINGLASTSAVFAGSTAQALYIADSGAADPYRIRTGSWGCWFRTAKRGQAQNPLSKTGASLAVSSYAISIHGTANVVAPFVSDGTSAPALTGVSDVCDDRWHHAVTTHDGTTARLYVDGVLEAAVAAPFPLNANAAAPLNLGAYGADAAVAAGQSHYGRVDEAFVTADVLTEDQVRCLYAAKLTHSLPVAPTAARVNVHRRRRGAALATTDFPTQPLRLYNFTVAGGATLSDQGSNNVTLTYNSGGSGIGADGRADTGVYFTGSGGGLSATDTGLPSAGNPRSYGAWFKSASLAPAGQGIIGWGSGAGVAAHAAVLIAGTTGILVSVNAADQIAGPFVADGQWHFMVCVEDFNSGDGVRRKLYLDGRLVGASTPMNSLTLAGANRFRIGVLPDATAPFLGQIDGAFVCGYALTFEQQAALYAKGAQDLGVSPKNEGDHVERLAQDGVLFIGDSLDSSYTVDVGVSA